MRLLYSGILISILICFKFVPGQSLDPVADGSTNFEKDLVNEINAVRLDPGKYSVLISSYVGLVRGKILYIPEKKPKLMFEGKEVLVEASNVLRNTSSVEVLQRSELLDRAARTQLNDLLVNDRIGHKGLDGSTLGTRLRRIGSFSGPVSENISHGAATPLEVVTSFLIDDGVKTRPHRKSLLNAVFREIGAACGVNSKGKQMCVVVLAKSFVPLSSKPTRLSPDSRN